MIDIEIIAEIGVNHNGNFNTALQLIDAARKCGCDTVKFQLFHGDRFPHLQLTGGQLLDLRYYAEACSLRFLCTPDDIEDAKRLVEQVGVERIKIGSSNVTNFKLLEKICDFDLPVILSTGACTFEECRRAVQIFKFRVPLTVMHCLSAYPPPYPYVQMNLGFLKKLVFFEESVGLSDHTMGMSISCLALAMGATVFEKHLTLSQFQDGPDHKTSAEPAFMDAYVRELHETIEIIGDGNKRIMPCEESYRADYERFVREQYVHSA